MPLPVRLSSVFPGTGSVKPCLCFIRSAQLIDRPPSLMPLPRISRALSMISAPRRKIFFGSHPRNAHVPPYGSASTIATFQPCDAHLFAAETPAMPAPITIKS
jgi:hypothetical protein